jgi:hypothetical protein
MVEILQAHLGLARAGKLRSLAVVSVSADGGSIATQWSCSNGDSANLIGKLTVLTHDLVAARVWLLSCPAAIPLRHVDELPVVLAPARVLARAGATADSLTKIVGDDVAALASSDVEQRCSELLRGLRKGQGGHERSSRSVGLGIPAATGQGSVRPSSITTQLVAVCRSSASRDRLSNEVGVGLARCKIAGRKASRTFRCRSSSELRDKLLYQAPAGTYEARSSGAVGSWIKGVSAGMRTERSICGRRG